MSKPSQDCGTFQSVFCCLCEDECWTTGDKCCTAAVDQGSPRSPDNLLHAHDGTSVKHFVRTVLLLNRCYFWMCNWCVRSILHKARESGLRPGTANIEWLRQEWYRTAVRRKGGRDKIHFLETSLQSKEFKVCRHTPYLQASVGNRHYFSFALSEFPKRYRFIRQHNWAFSFAVIQNSTFVKCCPGNMLFLGFLSVTALMSEMRGEPR